MSAIPSPPTAPGLEEFLAAAGNDKLLIKQCNTCGEVHYYPRQNCPFCFSGDTAWLKAKGTGTVYSYSVMRRTETPYAIAYVELAEGPRMLTNIVNCEFEAIEIGMPVRVIFKPSENGQKIPMFAPL